MKLVLDASVGLKFCLPEPDVAKALQLRDEFRKGMHELYAPDIFPVEIAHALSKACRQHRISLAEAKAHYASILSDCPDIQPSLPLLERAYELALDLRTRVYDCLYVCLAEEQGCLLVTADAKAVATFQGHPVIDLAQL
jgi:predicted nucleic acid-binding protein